MQIQVIERRHLAPCVELFLTVFNSPPWNEAWPAASAARRLEDLFNTPGFFGVIAMSEAALIGFALGHVEQWDRARHFYLTEMGVVPASQRSGIGTALIRRLCDEIATMQVARIYLLTARGGAAASFYEKCGFYTSQKMVMMAKYLGEPAP